MKLLRLSLLAIVAAAASACTYDGVRMAERQKCATMPHTQAERCYSRNSLTRTEYDAGREAVRSAADSPAAQQGKALDPRYEQWIP